jgi:hypothetical protein
VGWRGRATIPCHRLSSFTHPFLSSHPPRPPELAQTLTLDIPRLCDTPFLLPASAWPWAADGSGPALTARQASLYTQLYVEGSYPQFSLPTDGDNVPEKTFPLLVDVPIALEGEVR